MTRRLSFDQGMNELWGLKSLSVFSLGKIKGHQYNPQKRSDQLSQPEANSQKTKRGKNIKAKVLPTYMYTMIGIHVTL